tara:strand:+ start:77 stop:955 length:879 start_codon:yes stop_codon:yes gene_type:complete
MNKEYLNNQKIANNHLKNHFNNDSFILYHRQLAYEQIKNALDKNNNLIWSKLPKLVTQNSKLDKGSKYDFLNLGVQFAPSYISGFNVCSNASIECGMKCINFTGLGSKHMLNKSNIHMVLKARLIRTIIYFEYKEQFKKRVIKEINLYKNKVKKLNDNNTNDKEIKICIRLNVFSDIKWEKTFKEIFNIFSDLQFYDYTKVLNRNIKHLDNYHLTISRNEINKDVIKDIPNNKAYVFNIKRNDKMISTYDNKKVIDGDLHDLRFLDNKNVIVGLRYKGNNKDLNNNKFVINL